MFPSGTWPRTWALYNEHIDDAEYIGVYMGMNSFDDIFGVHGKTDDGHAVEDAGTMERFPMLWKLMTWTKDDGGRPRKTCTMTIVCEDGVAKAGLRERDRGLSLWTSSESILGVFAALEEALGAHPVDWRKLPEKWKGR